MADVGSIRATLVLNSDQFNRGMQNARTQMNNTSQSAKKVSKDIKAIHNASLAMGTAIAVGIGAAVKTAAEFEQKMADVKAVSGATGDQMTQLGDLAKEMGVKTAFSAYEAASGIEELIKAGLTVEQILGGGLKGALDLATAGGLELAEAAEIASTALNAFEADNLTVTDAANILAGAANASATDVHELKYGLSSVSAVAAGVGLSFKDTATALAAFAQNGLKGSDAGTSLKTMLMNLQPSTNAQIDEFERLGLMTYDVTKGLKVLADNGVKPASKNFNDVDKALKKFAATMSGSKVGSAKAQKEYTKLIMQTGVMQSAFYDAEGSLRSMDEIAGVLQDSLNGMTDAQRAASLEIMFGSDAIRAGNILYKEGAKGLDDMWAAMSNVTAADVAKVKLETFKGAFAEFQSTLESVGITIGEEFLPAFTDIVKFATDLVRKFGEVDGSTIKVGLAMAGATTAILLVGSTIAKLSIALRAFALTPVGAVITALSILGGVIAGVVVHQKEMSEVNLETAESLMEQHSSLQDNITQYDQLRAKAQLSNEELSRFADINSLISKTADPNVIAKLRAEQEQLRVKSGLSNDEMQRLLDLNGKILEVVPESNTRLSEQGTVLLNNTDAAKKYNTEQLEMIRLELEAQRAKAEANMEKNLLKEKTLLEQQKGLKKEMKEIDDSQIEQRKIIAGIEKDLATAKENNDKGEINRLQFSLSTEKQKLQILQDQKSEQSNQILKKQEEINKVQAQIGKLDEVKRKMVDIEMSQAGLNSKRGEEIRTIDSAIAKLKNQKVELEKTVPVSQRNTDEYREAAGAIQDQINKLQGTRSKIEEIIGKAAVMNDALGKAITKTVTIQTRGETNSTWMRSKIDPDFNRHTGGTFPKLHVGGNAAQFLKNLPNHNEVDVRLLRNEMVLTEAQQANLFRMLDAGVTTGSQQKVVAETDPSLIKAIESVASRPSIVVMDEREVGRIVEPHVTEVQAFKQDRKGRF
jgi:hypothetical protein